MRDSSKRKTEGQTVITGDFACVHQSDGRAGDGQVSGYCVLQAVNNRTKVPRFIHKRRLDTFAYLSAEFRFDVPIHLLG